MKASTFWKIWLTLAGLLVALDLFMLLMIFVHVATRGGM